MIINVNAFHDNPMNTIKLVGGTWDGRGGVSVGEIGTG
jgi:hypothetical protein